MICRTAINSAAASNVVTPFLAPFPWNEDKSVCRAADGYYGGIARHDELNFIWSVTPPGGKPKRGSATTHETAVQAVQFHISNFRSRADG